MKRQLETVTENNKKQKSEEKIYNQYTTKNKFSDLYKFLVEDKEKLNHLIETINEHVLKDRGEKFYEKNIYLLMYIILRIHIHAGDPVESCNITFEILEKMFSSELDYEVKECYLGTDLRYINSETYDNQVEYDRIMWKIRNSYSDDRERSVAIQYYSDMIHGMIFDGAHINEFDLMYPRSPVRQPWRIYEIYKNIINRTVEYSAEEQEKNGYKSGYIDEIKNISKYVENEIRGIKNRIKLKPDKEILPLFDENGKQVIKTQILDDGSKYTYYDYVCI